MCIHTHADICRLARIEWHPQLPQSLAQESNHRSEQPALSRVCLLLQVYLRMYVYVYI